MRAEDGWMEREGWGGVPPFAAVTGGVGAEMITNPPGFFDGRLLLFSNFENSGQRTPWNLPMIVSTYKPIT
jgi:hypothetical protein